MRKETLSKNIALWLFVTLSLSWLLLSRNSPSKASYLEAKKLKGHATEKRSFTCGPGSCEGPYKQGKQIIYKALTNCSQPDFLSNHPNPCWKSQQPDLDVVCSAKIILLGFHKSGTTDVSRWFKKVAAYTTGDYFISKLRLTPSCPMAWLEEFHVRRRYSEDTKRIAFDDCPGCAIVSRVIQENATFIIRQSAVQYLQYTMVDDSRYIITMREPADRMISHFFYVHKVQREDNPYMNMSISEVGNSYFQKLTSEIITSLIKCLQTYGTAVCVLESDLSPIQHPHPYLLSMITIGCYSVHLTEILKFIPKNRIYFSRLDDYSKDEAESITKVYKFVGIPITDENNPSKSIQKNIVKNAGYETKPVLMETRQALESFYKPFNVELAKILGDRKWLWR